MLYDGDTFTRGGRTFKVEFPRDDDRGAPWLEEDGHGPVTGLERREKAPGEMVLNDDRGAKRFYDFQEAVKIARRDGWGFLPYKMQIEPVAGEFKDYERRGGTVTAGPFSAFDPDDFNKAISSVYAQHRATMTERQYAAGAALANFKRLKDWCDDRWHYVGCVVTLLDDDDEETGETESLWGIESDCDDYLQETARELADQILARVIPIEIATIDDAMAEMRA
jgi:hypothetical protein